MNNPSEEQRNIINNIKNGVNIHVQAVAGSGKSTSVFSICKEFPSKNILLLTYNASLRLETKERARKYDLQNMEVHLKKYNLLLETLHNLKLFLHNFLFYSLLDLMEYLK